MTKEDMDDVLQLAESIHEGYLSGMTTMGIIAVSEKEPCDLMYLAKLSDKLLEYDLASEFDFEKLDEDEYGLHINLYNTKPTEEDYEAMAKSLGDCVD